MKSLKIDVWCPNGGFQFSEIHSNLRNPWWREIDDRSHLSYWELTFHSSILHIPSATLFICYFSLLNSPDCSLCTTHLRVLIYPLLNTHSSFLLFHSSLHHCSFLTFHFSFFTARSFLLTFHIAFHCTPYCSFLTAHFLLFTLLYQLLILQLLLLIPQYSSLHTYNSSLITLSPHCSLFAPHCFTTNTSHTLLITPQ